MTQDVNVYFINFSAPGNEMVVENEDGTYTILINARLSDTGRIHAYKHAMKHIANRDFSKTDVQKIEAKAHELIATSNIHPITSAKYEEQIRRIRAERKRIKKQMKVEEKKLEFMFQNGFTDFFRYAEHNHLYGDYL